MAVIKKPQTGFVPFESDDWTEPEMDLVESKNTFSVENPMEPLEVKSSMSVGNPATPSTDWGAVGKAGIGAAGQAVGTIAQIAGQKYAMDRAAEANAANRTLSEKLAKMQIAASQDDYLRQQNLRALIWALNANRGARDVGNSARDVRRAGIEGMDDLLAKVMLKRG